MKSESDGIHAVDVYGSMGRADEGWRERFRLTSKHHLVKELTELLTQVKDEQSYIVMRERTHRNTAESTNGRVKWWSIFQLGVLIGEGIFQVWWLKRFFEVCLLCLWGVSRDTFWRCMEMVWLICGCACRLSVSFRRSMGCMTILRGINACGWCTSVPLC